MQTASQIIARHTADLRVGLNNVSQYLEHIRSHVYHGCAVLHGARCPGSEWVTLETEDTALT